MFKFDLDTYNLTKDLPGGATLTVVEEDVAEIQMILDKNDAPTLGGVIGYSLAYLLMVGFVGSIYILL